MRFCSMWVLAVVLELAAAEPVLSVRLKGSAVTVEAGASASHLSVLDCSEDFAAWKECALFAPAAAPQGIDFSISSRAQFFRLRAFALPLELKAGQPFSLSFAASSSPAAQWTIDGGPLPEGVNLAVGKLAGTPSAVAAEANSSGFFTNMLEAVFGPVAPGGSAGEHRMFAQIVQHVRLSYSQNIYPARPNGPSFGTICIKCHGSGFPPDFSPSATTLIEMKAGSGGECPETLTYLVPGNLGASLIYQKVLGQACGDRMPQGGPYFNQTQIDRLARWIAELEPGESD